MSENPAQEPSGRLSAVLHTATIVILQAILFFGAATALTLFYLSYRPGDFIQSAILTSLLMIPPWFIVSLLPTLFGLNDSELKTEMLGVQFLCLIFIFVVIVGLAISIDYHPVLIDQAVFWFEKSLLGIKGALSTTATLIKELYSDISTFFMETFRSLLVD